MSVFPHMLFNSHLENQGLAKAGREKAKLTEQFVSELAMLLF